MTFLVALLVWVVVLGLVFALALFAIRQLPLTQPFKSAAIAIMCIIAIVVLLGFLTGQIPMAGYVHR